ncbi:hypothetical protein MPH_02352 [Macrophomina phaseolina MS6]|uniref:Xylanolytic transcriptional activator regulatory domain-containing protein n=1 Tax=Macrophomina phaseolina (strain MS6) TaxID=1126212 RepID=K2S021_MACPH|nr:hypothetical protein MPH_02352 [Macrophomina phaseolina MS6]
MLGSTSRGAPDQQSDIPAARAIKRKYTSKACEECRRRRAKVSLTACNLPDFPGKTDCFEFLDTITNFNKCDGAKPACTRCTGRGIECHFRFEEDGRRPAPKSYVQLLRNRIEVLERALRANGIDVDAAVAQAIADGGPVVAPSADPNAPTSFESEAGASSTQFEELCVAFEGALSLDESLNFDQDDNEVQVPTDLKAELIDNYFTWDGPWFHVVNEELFRKSEPINGRTELRTNPNDANTAGKAFLEKAEELLQYELKFPNITTVQALSLIGTMYFAIGADAPGWMHHGMGMRLALDLGLNLDAAALSGSHLIPSEELELRRQLYWAMYTNDKLAAGYTGRVCTMLVKFLLRMQR